MLHRKLSAESMITRWHNILYNEAVPDTQRRCKAQYMYRTRDVSNIWSISGQNLNRTAAVFGKKIQNHQIAKLKIHREEGRQFPSFSLLVLSDVQPKIYRQLLRNYDIATTDLAEQSNSMFGTSLKRTNSFCNLSVRMMRSLSSQRY